MAGSRFALFHARVWGRSVSLARQLHMPLLMALAAVVISYVDPLGLDDATAERAHSTMMRLAAPFYRPSNRVTVVLLDQAYLDARPDRRWPLPYAEQGLLLRRIAGWKPAAIFVDLLYQNPHSQADDVPENLFAPIQSLDVPIYLAGLPARDRADGTVTLDSASTRAIAPALSAARAARPEAFPVVLAGWDDQGDRYPLRVDGAPGQSAALRTAGYALYQEYCRQAEAATRAACRKDVAGSANEPITVQWGAFVPERMRRHHEDCQYPGAGPGILRTLRATGRQFLVALVDRTGDATTLEDRLPCAAVAVLPASILMGPADEGNEQLIRDALGPACDDSDECRRLVVLGASVAGIQDSASSPVHGQVPGAFVHAMALDNLVSGSRLHPLSWLATALYKLIVLGIIACIPMVLPPAPPKVARAGDRSLVVAGVTVWLGCALFAALHGQWLATLGFVAGGALMTFLAPYETGKITLLFVLVCIVSLISVQLGWEPTNWISMAIAASLVYEIANNQKNSRGE